jgi:CubicO group peptidase (beta-lactamase class C family)
MKKLFILGAALLISSCCCKQDAGDAQAFSYKPDYKEIEVDESRLGRIDSLLKEYVDKGIIPHALTFVAKDGQVIHNKAFGWRDVEKRIALEKDDIFRMYSQTKAVTTVALMTLFEQGKFQLDDPVSKYIPEMTNQALAAKTESGVTTTREAASPVLIRHVLSHSSGIGARLNQSDFGTLEEYVKALVKEPLLYDPGTGWNYHPASDVWGYLVEVLSGQTLQDYVRENVIEPLGIKDMAYFYDKSYADRFVTVYREKDGVIAPAPDMWSGRYPFGDDTRYASGGTGLNGTIEGYARFCQMILNKGAFNGKRILGRRTIEIMAKDQLAHPGSVSDDFHFGVGFQIYPEDAAHWNANRDFSPMVSGGSLSWGGMANTDYIIDFKENMIILLYTNRVPDTLVWEKFLNTVYQTLE